MTISIELSAEEVEQLKELTRQDNDADAVTQAAREYLRLRRLRELKAVSGKMDFEEHCDQS